MTTHLNDEQLIDYLHGELAPSEDAAFAQHIESCAECRVRAEEERRLTESLRSYARATEREMPVGIRHAVWAEIERPRGIAAWRDTLTAWMRPVVAIPAIAALLAIGFFGFQAAQPRATSIDASYYLDDHAALTSAAPFSQGNPEPASLLTETADAE
jgi:anti-sigma factor RsiW